jgi:spoIIIJ-associated protein
MGDELSTHEQRGQQWLEQLLHLSKLPATVIVGSPDHSLEAESCWLTISADSLTAEQVESLIGPGGVAIDAIQYLANTLLNLGHRSEQQQAYTIELNGYRVQRQAQLRLLAEEAAALARSTAQESTIKSLSSAERRLIHTYLQQFDDIETYSQGQEPNRFLTVRLVQPESSG